jgi:hypothetical protein
MLFLKKQRASNGEKNMPRIGFEGAFDNDTNSRDTASTVTSTLPSSCGESLNNNEVRILHQRSKSMSDAIPSEIILKNNSHVERLSQQRQRCNSIDSVRTL